MECTIFKDSKLLTKWSFTTVKRYDPNFLNLFSDIK